MDISSKTEVVILLIAVLTGIVLLYVLIMACGLMIFSPFAKIKEFYTDCCSNIINWTLVGVLVIIFFIIVAILFVISTLIRKLAAKRSLLFRCKCFSIIGYGGIALCGIVPRIAVFFLVGDDLYINWYITLISFVTTHLIYCIILLPNAKHFKVDYDLDGTLSWVWKHAVVHIIVFIGLVRLAIALFEDGNDRGAVIVCQFLYSLICVPSIFDFCQVLRSGGVKLRKTPVNTIRSTNGANQNQSLVAKNKTIVKADKTPECNVKVECKNYSKINQSQGLMAGNEKNLKAAEIPENNFKVECKICTMEYSETRIPRNLKECGHTVCEVCANELLKKNNQVYLCCPFCQEVTMVKGPANLLPKNYVALEFFEKMK